MVKTILCSQYVILCRALRDLHQWLFLFASCLNGSVQIMKRGGDPALTLFFSCFYNNFVM